ncbi:hypothetical protein BASA81_002751 [Batrachochytrium salamandrivorans]|nr:hypothetical protein BASA81_002751 [Batrachochytrium salamandrivorans]
MESSWNLSTSTSSSSGGGGGGRRLSGEAGGDVELGGVEEDEYQKHRKRISRRKPLPPIDLQGISHSFSLPRSNTHQHSSFSNVKPRHQFMKPFEAHATATSAAANASSSQLATPITPPKPNTSAVPLSSPSSSAAPLPLHGPKTYSTYHCCYCLQIHVEKNRSCTSTLLWLCMLLLLISAFSILTVFLSHYYFGLFSLSRHEMQFLNKFYTGGGGSTSGGGGSTSGGGKPWTEPEWLAVPTDPTKLVRPPALLGLPTSFPKSTEFMQSALAFAQKHDLDELSTAVFPHGLDVINALGMFPNAQSVVLFGGQAVPTLEAIIACDAACLQLGSEFARKAGEDLEMEGFVLPKTLKLGDGGELGILPVLLTSIKAVGGEVVHLAEINVAQLRCLHLHVSRRTNSDTNKLSVVYCGALDEKSEDQRVFLRNLLKAQPQPLGLVLRGTGYKLFANLKPEDTAMFNLHLKAMLMSLAQVIVQDDSGIPFHLLQKHFGKVELFGEYRGLGDPGLSGLERQSGSVIRSLYQKDLAELAPTGPLPFRFGYRMVIGPAGKDKLAKAAQAAVAAEEREQHTEVFLKRNDFKGSHLILAKS